jgi:hypothetical protein
LYVPPINVNPQSGTGDISMSPISGDADIGKGEAAAIAPTGLTIVIGMDSGTIEVAEPPGCGTARRQ